MKSKILYLFVVVSFISGVLSDNNTIIINGSTQPDIPSASTVTTTSAPNITTVPPTPPTTTKPSTTTQNATTTSVPTTTVSPTTTNAPNVTTASTTPSSNASSTTESTTAVPTAAPSHKGRKFDGPSFIGGIILAAGLMAICFVSWKFYKARTERNYHTL